MNKYLAKLPGRFSSKRTANNEIRVRTFFGPGFYGCTGTTGLAPMLQHFPVDGVGSVFIVGVCMTNPDFLHMMFHKASKFGQNRIRVLKDDTPRRNTGKIKYKVFYTRKSAVAEFARLIDEATARNERLASEHRYARLIDEYC